jgi:hypothetical protein
MGVLYAAMTALMLFALAISLRDLVVGYRARSDLMRAVARSSSADKERLFSLLDAGDTDGAVSAISPHLAALPPREQKMARAALFQPTQRGRLTYAGIIASAALRGA